MDKRSLVAEQNPYALFADGFDEAIIGYIVCNAEEDLTLAYYDSQKCVEILMEDGMTEDEALDYFYFNVLSPYMGINTPVFRPFLWDEEDIDEDMVGKVLSADGGFVPDTIYLFEEENEC